MKIAFTLQLAVVSAMAICGSANAEWATLKGQFVYGGESATPSGKPLVVTKDVQVCGKNPLVNESLVVNEENRGVANIVLWAFKPKGQVHASYEESAKDTVEMKNLGCRFEPHVVAVRTSQTFQVGNPDPVGHNSLINFIKNPGVNPIIPAGSNVKFNLKKPEIIPVKVSCSIHPWMEGIVLVQDHPYMAVTDKDGKFELAHLPTGKLTLKVWHEKAGYVQTVDIDGKETKWKRGKYAINLSGGKDEEHKYTLDPKVFEK